MKSSDGRITELSAATWHGPRRLRMTVAIVVALFFGIAFGMGSWILRLQAKARDARTAEVLIARLRGETNHMNALEMAAMAGDNSADMAREAAAASSVRSARLMAELNQVVPEQSVKALEQAVSAYESRIHTAIDLFVSGKTAAGQQLDANEVDPLESQVAAEVESADSKLSREASSEAAEARLGTVVTLAAGALLLAGLCVFLAQAVKSSAKLQAGQAAIIQAERRWSSLIQNVSDIIAVADEHGQLLFVSPAATSMLGLDVGQMVGKPVYEFVHSEESIIARLVTEEMAMASHPVDQEWRLIDINGDPHACDVKLTNLTQDEYVKGILLTFRDVTERKRFEAQLTHQAFHDVLTGLPNRALLHERLYSALERTKRSGKFAGLLFLDLDNFKVVNDSLGHDEGDRLLVELAVRLKASVRSYDTVARLGGDEFMVLVDDVADSGELTVVADQILARLRKPIMLQGRAITPSASIGIAISDDASTPETLVRDADTAMYHAKSSGKAGYAHFTPSMSERALERLELEGDLRGAIEDGQMLLAYQPIYSLSPSRVCGIEALVRWQHPTRGIISPLSFIPIAEDTGLIVPLGDWVLVTACQAAAEWIASGDVAASFMLNVNVSALQLLEANFVPRVVEILGQAALAPGNLKLEITESVIMANLEECVDKMRQLRALGVQVAIDDFGTGYSSMAQLSMLPVDTLKIDRAFVNRIGKGADDDAIIGAIIAMARSMGLEITSEGIETADQLRFLENLGCGQGQGFLLAKPMPAESVTEFLASQVSSSIEVAKAA